MVLQPGSVFGFAPPEEKHGETIQPTDSRAGRGHVARGQPLGGQLVVENAGKLSASGVDWAALQQQQAAERERIFRLLAEQQQVALYQVMTGQTAAKQQMWDWVVQLVAAQTSNLAKPAGHLRIFWAPIL